MVRGPHVLLALIAGLSGCAVRDPGPPEPADAGGPVVEADAGDEPDAGGPLSQRDGGPRSGAGPDAGAIPPLPPEVIDLRVDTFEPRRGPASGGTLITLTGRGLLRDTVVTIGGAPLLDMANQSERRITGRTPPGTAGVAAVFVRNRAGAVEIAGGFTYEDSIAIASVEPARGPASGGTALTVTGAGFRPGSALLVGDRPAFAVRVESPARITAVSPPGRAGLVPVSVVNRSGLATREDAFRYVPDLRIRAVDPPVGPTAGGNVVRIRGEGLDSADEVRFGASPAAIVDRNGGELAVVVPAAGAPGPVDVSVRSPDVSDRLRDGYAYFAGGTGLAIHGVSPSSGPASGGTDVHIVGSDFDQGVSEVRIGGRPATGVVLEDDGVLRATTPAGAPGPADVVVVGADGSATLPAGFEYEPTLAVVSASPPSGPVAGGTDVELRGEGFAPGAEVFFGPVAAASVRIVDGRTLVARTAPGGAGPVDVVVRVGERRARLPGGFTYVEAPQLYRVTPVRGAIAGGTWVRLVGAGFTPSSRPFFNGLPAVDVRLVSASVLTARTPPGTVGPADLVVTSALGSASLPAAYLYFDPANRLGGTSGGPSDGAVNVTVFSSADGRRVGGALVTLATSGPTVYQGLTNENGQIVFSGPDLFGRQTVTAGKENHTTTSIVAFDAENVSLYLSPLVGGGLAPGRPPREPPTVSGLLKSAFKGIPPPPEGYQKAILVTTTATSRTRAQYIPEGFLQILSDDGREDRPYEIKTRPGDVAVYALGGHLNGDATVFVPHVMGLHRYLRVLPQERVTGIDVTIDASLNRTLDVRLLNAPPLSPDGPTVYRMRVYLDLGIEGLVTFFQLPESRDEPRLVQEHLPLITGTLRGAHFVIAVGAYNLIDGWETSPMSVLVKDRVTDLSQPIEVGPMMPIAGAVRPWSGGTLEDLRFAWSLDPPPRPSVFLIYLPQTYVWGTSSLWDLVVPGNLREMVVPDLPALAGFPELPAGAGLDWYITSVETARPFDIDAYDLNDLWGDWRSYSSVRHAFTNR